MDDRKRAENILKSGNHSVVFVKDDKIIISDKKGVSPLLSLIDKKEDLNGYSAADKIVGKASAMLFQILNVKSIHANVLSKGGMKIFEKNNVSFTYDTLTENIKNRDNTDFCPMEIAVKNIDDINLAYKAMQDKIKELQESK